MEDPALSTLEQSLSYRFADRSLLLEALRHRSFINEQTDSFLRDNERLEFLGDAVLNLAAAQILMQRYPEHREGDLSRLRAALVSDSSLAAMAADIHLGDYLLLGKGETQTGGHKKKSILANAFEAVLAAIFLDGGFSVVFQIIEARLESLLKKIKRPDVFIDFKTLLQETVQENLDETPVYSLVEDSGPDHDKTFVARVSFAGLQADGTGKSKKAAEQEAARMAFEMLARHE